jgi:EAL and modified HD-GYP domain-containing signal transduction protein
MAFVRGRFCELAAALSGLDRTEQYLLGLLSLLPAMLRLPMQQLTPLLPLRDEIRGALEGAKNPDRMFLDWLEFEEQGNWAACDAVVQKNGLNEVELVRCYAEAVVWAEAALHSAL